MKEKVFFHKDVLIETDHGIVPIASRCRQCGTVYFPKEARCNQDLCKDMEIIEVPQYGKLKTFTVLYRPANQYPIPHGLALVEFEEGYSIEGPMVIDEPDKLVRGHEFVIGSKMETIVDTLWEDEGHEYIGYKFKVVGPPEEGSK